VPALWLLSLDERALRERLRRRMHLVRLRTSANGRIFGLQTQWGVRVSLARLRRGDSLALLERACVPEVWRCSVSECLDGVLAVGLADDGDGAGRVLDDLVADRAEQEAGEPAVPSVSDHDQVGVSRLFE
jgi:hypothetical protein